MQSIQEGAFFNCKKLAKISLPSTLIDISGNAFSGNDLITSVRIPDSVNRIDRTAFGFSADGKQNTSFVFKGSLNSIASFHAEEHGFIFLEEGTSEIKDAESGASVLLTEEMDDSYVLSFGSFDSALGNSYLMIGDEVIKGYRLKLLRDGQDIGYSGTAEIRIPISAEPGEPVKAFVLKEDGTFQALESTITDNFLVFRWVLGDFYLSSTDLSSFRKLTVEHRYDDNTLISTPSVYFALPGASYHFEASAPNGYTTEHGILQGAMPNQDLTLTFRYAKIVITTPTETIAPPVTLPQTPDTDPIVSGGSRFGGKLVLLLLLVVVAILIAISALVFLSMKKKRDMRQRDLLTRNHSHNLSSEKFAHTIVIPDAPTQELNVQSLFAEEPEEDADAVKKQKKKKSSSKIKKK